MSFYNRSYSMNTLRRQIVLLVNTALKIKVECGTLSLWAAPDGIDNIGGKYFSALDKKKK